MYVNVIPSEGLEAGVDCAICVYYWSAMKVHLDESKELEAVLQSKQSEQCIYTVSPLSFL